MRQVPQFSDALQFIDLSHGHTHYHLSGPADGPLVLLIHGATVPAWEFERLAPLLNLAGYRTAAIDLYGHGYSARPPGPYSLEFLSQQVGEFLEKLSGGHPCFVLGHSLGAAIAAKLTTRLHLQIQGLVWVAPLVDFFATVPAARLLTNSLLGPPLVHSFVVPMLKRRRAIRYANIADGVYIDKFVRQTQYSGFARALASLLRHGALANQLSTYVDAAHLEVPTLILRGEHDEVCNAQQIVSLQQAYPHARYQEIAEVGHQVLLSYPEKAAPLVVDFLRQS